MSILIRGMEMPKSCDKCELMTANYGCAFVGAVGGESYRKRAWDCPLIEVPEPMKWIPVTERLPEKNQEVLIFLFGEDPYIAWHNGEYWSTEDFRLDEPDDWQPTYWFPLPQPPESEGEP